MVKNINTYSKKNILENEWKTAGIMMGRYGETIVWGTT